MWLSIGLGCVALMVVTAVPLMVVAARTALNPQERARHAKTISVRCGLLFDCLARLVDPLTTWSYRHRVAGALQRAGVVGWTSAHLFALQLVCAIGLAVVNLMTVFNFAEAPVVATSTAATSVLGWLIPAFWMRCRRRARIAEITRGMPSFLDLLCLGLDCGMNLQSSVQLALDHLPAGALRAEWSRMLMDMRSGMTRAEALRQLSNRVDVPTIRQLVASLAQSERVGLSLTRILGDFARHERARRMMAAEKQAMRAPVKMLVPLSLCIFPCTFLILGFPVFIVVSDLAP